VRERADKHGTLKSGDRSFRTYLSRDSFSRDGWVDDMVGLG
jgi:hypothetical protein